MISSYHPDTRTRVIRACTCATCTEDAGTGETRTSMERPACSGVAPCYGLSRVGAEFFTLGLTLKHFTEELLHELAYSWSFLTVVLAGCRVKTVAKDFMLRYYGVNEVQEHRLWS